MIKIKDPKEIWLLTFVLLNIVAGLIMYSTGELIGDVKGGTVYDYTVLFCATLMVILSYYLILGPLFRFFGRIKINQVMPSFDNGVVENSIGLLILFFQILYIAFNVIYGVNVAGANNAKSNGLIAIFWALFPIDSIFLIFYGVARDNKYFKINALVYLVSNVLRGWAGVFLFFIFMEWCRLYRNGKVKISKTLIVFVAVLVVYPVLNGIKFYIRVNQGGYLG